MKKTTECPFLILMQSVKKGKFTTSVYREPTFSRIYTHFDSFLPVCYIHSYIDASGFTRIGLSFT